MFKKSFLCLLVSFATYTPSAQAVTLACSNSIYENIFSGRSDLPHSEWAYLAHFGQWDCEGNALKGDYSSYRATFGGLSIQAGYSSSAVIVACTGKNPEGTYIFAGGSCSVGVGCQAHFSLKASLKDPSVCIISGMKFGFESPGVKAGIMTLKRVN